MQVDKENTQKIIEYMNRTTNDWVHSSGRIITSLNARYSFTKFFTEKGLMDNAKVNLHNTFVECPFHEDASPSLSFSEEKHVYQCFSCGSHGNIINLMAEYDTKIKGINMSFYQKMNEILLEDPLMSSDLGITSIYRNDEISLQEGLTKFVPKGLSDRFNPSSFLELASYMKKHGCQKRDVKLFILLMCSGMTV